MNNNNFIYQYSIFLFSLIGVFLTFQILSSLNTDCTSGGCSNLSSNEDYYFFGIPNYYLGMIHYTILSTLSFISLYTNRKVNKWIVSIRNTMIIFGFLYSIYLISIMFNEQKFCQLCFYSATISSLLLLFLLVLGINNKTVEVKKSIKYLYIFSILAIICLIIFNPSKSVNNAKATTLEKISEEIEVLESVVMGNLNAQITILEFTDFQCRYCAEAATLVNEILNKYPEDVKIVIKNAPLSFHKQAYKAAQYALAANEQGKYKEMYYAIFADYKKLNSNEDWPLEIAQELGLDMNKFVKDFGSDKIKKQIDLEMSQFRNSGFKKLSVPKFVIQGKEFLGERDIETFSKIIDKELNL